jgi:hypothetical protein
MDISNSAHEDWNVLDAGPGQAPSPRNLLNGDWRITGSQLHLHGQDPATDADFDEVFLQPDIPMLDSQEQLLGNDYLDVSLPPTAQGATDDILDVPTAELLRFAWPSDESTASPWTRDFWPSFAP